MLSSSITFIKGLEMSRLDLRLQKKVIRELNDMIKDPVDTDDTFFNEEGIASLDMMDTDLQDWLEVFEEDEVILEGCR